MNFDFAACLSWVPYESTVPPLVFVFWMFSDAGNSEFRVFSAESLHHRKQHLCSTCRWMSKQAVSSPKPVWVSPWWLNVISRMLSISFFLSGLLALSVLQLPKFQAFFLVAKLQVHWGKLRILWRIDFFPENKGHGMMVATSFFHWLPFFFRRPRVAIHPLKEVGATLHGGSRIHFHLIWNCWTSFMVFFFWNVYFLEHFLKSECLFRTRMLIGAKCGALTECCWNLRWPTAKSYPLSQCSLVGTWGATWSLMLAWTGIFGAQTWSKASKASNSLSLLQTLLVGCTKSPKFRWYDDAEDLPDARPLGAWSGVGSVQHLALRRAISAWEGWCEGNWWEGNSFVEEQKKEKKNKSDEKKRPQDAKGHSKA